VYSIKAMFAALFVVTAACAPSNATTSNDPRLARLLEDRQAIWQAWFTNDRSRLEQLLPNSVIAINNGDTTWQDRSAVLASAEAFARGGGKLVSLTFPKTEKQVFGDVAILYSTYVAELDQGGKRSVQRGRASEIFVWRNGVWQNAGWHLDAGC
jgi:uncharacterized protein DUF4440